jgi:uncharacterized protein
MITITPHPEGCLLAVLAQPNARKSAVLGEQAGALKVAVTAVPEDGKANTAIGEILRDWLELKRSQIDLAGGASSRKKLFLIRCLTPDELRALIASRTAAG